MFQVPKVLRMPTAAFSLICTYTTTHRNRQKSNSSPRAMVRSASIPTFTTVARFVSVCSVPGAVPDGNRPRAPFYKFWLAFRGSFLCPIPISMNPAMNIVEIQPKAEKKVTSTTRTFGVLRFSTPFWILSNVRPGA